MGQRIALFIAGSPSWCADGNPSPAGSQRNKPRDYFDIYKYRESSHPPLLRWSIGLRSLDGSDPLRIRRELASLPAETAGSGGRTGHDADGRV